MQSQNWGLLRKSWNKYLNKLRNFIQWPSIFLCSVSGRQKILLKIGLVWDEPSPQTINCVKMFYSVLWTGRQLLELGEINCVCLIFIRKHCNLEIHISESKKNKAFHPTLAAVCWFTKWSRKFLHSWSFEVPLVLIYICNFTA